MNMNMNIELPIAYWYLTTLAAEPTTEHHP